MHKDQRRRIAIVEDDFAIAQMYRTKLELAGYEVTVDGNGKDGAETIVQTAPDLVLLDIMMPVMSGDKCLKSVRANPKTQSTPVVVMTNLGREEAPKILDRLGVAKYIVKSDYTPRQVLGVVEGLLHCTNGA